MDTRLVVVGIDEKLNKKLGDLLDQLGFDVSIFTDVISLMNFFESNEASLAFIGEVGDGGPGYSVCRQLRERYLG